MISLLITWRMRHVPASGAKVRPVRRTFWISVATPTVNASTRSDGSDRLTQPVPSWLFDEVGDEAVDAGEVGARQRRERDLVVAGAAQAVAHHRAHLLLGSLAHRARDHPGLAEAAAAGAAAEDLDVEPVVHDLDERDELVLRVRPVGEVGDGALVDGRGHVGVAWADGDEGRAVVLDVVHRRHVDARDRRELAQDALAATCAARRASTRASTSVISPTTSSPSPITKASTKSASGSGLKAQWPPATTSGCSGPAVLAAHRDAGEVDAVQDVRVDELGREVEREDVEVAGGAVGVDGEQRRPVRPQLGLEVDPRRVGALGRRVVAFVEDLVEDLEPLVGEADLVGVGVDEQPGDLVGPVLRPLRSPAPSRCSGQASPPWPGEVRSSATGSTSEAMPTPPRATPSRTRLRPEPRTS